MQEHVKKQHTTTTLTFTECKERLKGSHLLNEDKQKPKCTEFKEMFK